MICDMRKQIDLLEEILAKIRTSKNGSLSIWINRLQLNPKPPSPKETHGEAWGVRRAQGSQFGGDKYYNVIPFL